MSGYVSQMIDSTIRYSKDLMGASDAALGNVKPDNTSAIVAVQKAAGMPLDLQRMDFYNFVESVIRIFIDMMRVNYGLRNITLTDEEGAQNVTFDYSALNDYVLRLKIDIGQAAYWSELTQVQTLDNLMDRKILPDAVTYLESLPDGYVKNKKDIIEKIKQTMQMQAITEAAASRGGPMGELMPEQPPLPETPPMSEQLPQGGLTDSQIADIAVQLMEKTGGEAMRLVEAMQIADTDKERVVLAYEELKNGGSGDDLQQMRK